MAFKLFILIIVSLTYHNALSAVIGDNCTAENENGVCTLLKDCERKSLPDYIGPNSIVCWLPTKEKREEEIPEE